MNPAALFNALTEGDCFILRRGTIEDCFLNSTNRRDKFEDAAREATSIIEDTEDKEDVLRARYGDVLAAVERAAARRRVDDNIILRRVLGSLLGEAFQRLTPEMTNEALNATARDKAALRIFKLENACKQESNPRIRVTIVSPLFKNNSFVVSRANMHADIERNLTSTNEGF